MRELKSTPIEKELWPLLEKMVKKEKFAEPAPKHMQEYASMVLTERGENLLGWLEERRKKPK